MLSKIVSGEKVETLELMEYHVPTPEQVDDIIEDRKHEMQRRRIVHESIDDPLKAAKDEANKILSEAQDKLKNAKVEALTLKARQEKEIRKQLEQEYQKKLETQLAKLTENYQNTIETLGTLQQLMYQKNEKELVDLVFSITRKIIGDEIKTTPEIVIGMLQKGFEKIKEAREFNIKLHPDDYEMVLKQKAQLKEMLKTSGSIEFQKDESVERGGCKILTDSGEISSEPGKQLEIIMKELADET
jgi:flagellar assembly protein FliH